MSKTSKPADRWSQVFTAARDRPEDFCTGCGYHLHVYGKHRADCTTLPPPCPICLYYPAVHGEHRANCTPAKRKEQAA
jgi:hypothetical protein